MWLVRDLISHTYFQDETEFNYSVCVTVSLFRLVYGKINRFFDMKLDVWQEEFVAGNCQWTNKVNFIFPSNMGPKQTCCHRGSHSISSAHQCYSQCYSSAYKADWVMRVMVYHLSISWKCQIFKLPAFLFLFCEVFQWHELAGLRVFNLETHLLVFSIS